MTDIIELRNAYEAIALRYFRHEITREQRNAMVIALRDSPAAAGLTFEQRDAIANEASKRAADIIDEVYFSNSGRWMAMTYYLHLRLRDCIPERYVFRTSRGRDYINPVTGDENRVIGEFATAVDTERGLGPQRCTDLQGYRQRFRQARVRPRQS